jgi:NAD(P)-dependent dehydrogenase (short-subunit alcohol dehydrogenase family)
VCAAQSPEARWSYLVDVTEADMEDLWKSGAMATLAFMRAVRPHMLKTGGGAIVNFGSGSQHNPTKYGVYAGVKAAIQAISRAAAQEWGRDGIRVNTVLPFVASPAATHDFANNPGVEQAAIGRTALGRLGDPERDIGPAIAFLVSEDSRYITGSTLSLDGGITYLR